MNSVHQRILNLAMPRLHAGEPISEVQQSIWASEMKEINKEPCFKIIEDLAKTLKTSNLSTGSATVATVPDDSEDFGDIFAPVEPSKIYPTTLLGWALWCVEKGWCVFPCLPHKKSPACEHGFKDAASDPKQVRAWYTQNPELNYGIALGASNLVVADFDTAKPFVAGVPFADDVPTFTVQTGRNVKDGVAGIQKYYRGSCKTRNMYVDTAGNPTTDESSNGVENHKIGEVRSRGAYVIGPGCHHPDGNLYRVLTDIALAESPEQNEHVSKPSGPAIGTDEQSEIAQYVEAAFDDAEIVYGRRRNYKEEGNGFIWQVICPWDEVHSVHITEPTSSSCVIMESSGRLLYECKHRCLNVRQWKEFRAWMESKAGHKLPFGNKMPELPITVGGVLPQYLQSEDDEEEASSMHDAILKLSQAGKTPDEIAEESGFNRLVAESLTKETAKAEAVGEITDDQLDREFPAYDGKDVGPIPTLIEGFLPKGANFFGSLSGVGKTWLGLSVAKALTAGEPLFGVFPVKEKVAVLYLIPEASDGTFKNRMKLMKITREKTLFRYRTISQGVTLSLRDPLTVKMIQKLRQNGRRQVLVIADTAIRFLQADDENSSTQNSLVTDSDYLRSKDVGADLLFMHHSPKESKKAAELTLENVLRGTGDFGAMADVVYGIRRDENLYAYGEGPEELDVVCVKPRDLENPPLPFRVVLKRKDTAGGRPVSVINATGDVVYVGPEAVKSNAGNLLDFTLRTDPYTSLNSLTKVLKMRRELVKDLAKSRGWSQAAEVVFGPDGAALKASNGLDKKRFRWTQITVAGQLESVVTESKSSPESESAEADEVIQF